MIRNELSHNIRGENICDKMIFRSHPAVTSIQEKPDCVKINVDWVTMRQCYRYTGHWYRDTTRTNDLT